VDQQKIEEHRAQILCLAKLKELAEVAEQLVQTEEALLQLKADQEAVQHSIRVTVLLLPNQKQPESSSPAAALWDMEIQAGKPAVDLAAVVVVVAPGRRDKTHPVPTAAAAAMAELILCLVRLSFTPEAAAAHTERAQIVQETPAEMAAAVRAKEKEPEAATEPMAWAAEAVAPGITVQMAAATAATA